ncbi:MAG: beta-propeller domain-containing protein [Jiangellaceae bacterium]
METASRSAGRFVGLASALLFLSACTGGGAGIPQPPVGQVAAALRLVSFDDCADALAEMQEAASEHVTAYGLGGGMVTGDLSGAAEAAGADSRASAPLAATQDGDAQAYSTTNTHEAGVDEPDLVKTDGRRIFTIVDGTLRVVDAESRRLTGTLPLSDAENGQWWADQMLLSGDRALVMGSAAIPFADPALTSDRDIAASTFAPAGSRIVLVDISGEPRVLSDLQLDGWYVDARQVGSVVRLVVQSGPRLAWTYPDQGRSEDEALAANRTLLAESTIEDWLPRHLVNGESQGSLVDCGDVHHPPVYSGTSMLTVLSLDLAGSLRAEGSVAVVADGQTVYGTETSLYIADDRRGFPMPVVTRAGVPVPDEATTEIHKFDVSESDAPRYVASGRVDGWLLNQYSLSEHDGHLRVATTQEDWALRGQVEDGRPASESQVSVLSQRDDRLVEVGSVGGLGEGEQIYAVRFIGPVGYVVTFRQTDPLHTLDLSEPARPRVVGELKIPGYSAYLHPAGEGRLIGVGQDADSQGRVLGAQVSLFDVSDPAAPARLDTYGISGGWSDAEHDPHAFLFWPDTGTVVIPVWAYGDADSSLDQSQRLAMAGGALVLRLDGDALTEVGVLSHVESPGDVDWSYDPSIRRSLVIGDTLWTVSGSGALASDLDDLDEQAWVPFAG